MRKCINCSWEGKEEEVIHKNYKHCPICGDNTILLDNKKEPANIEKQKKNILSRIKEITEDLLDDGKLNYSNNLKKKSPGRKKNYKEEIIRK
jgi:hypothetical protein